MHEVCSYIADKGQNSRTTRPAEEKIRVRLLFKYMPHIFLFLGIGHGMVVMTGIVAIYYNVILSWAIYYFAMSFNAVLPWSNCDNDWNTDSCYMRMASNTTGSNNQSTFNVTLSQKAGYGNQSYLHFDFNNTESTMLNVTISTVSKSDPIRRTPTEEFWQ